MKETTCCKNKCIFCFIDQLPGNLRPSLYIKDDDYLLSYMYGNFITLTNLSGKDIKKIIKYRLEPLYVSVHSLDPGLRSIIFRNKDHLRGLSNLKTLDDANIKTNIQIVLVSGLNDGKNLIETLDGLISDYKNIISIGIVPAGITRYNKCQSLKPFNSEETGYTIDIVDDFNKNYYNNAPGQKKVFLSDEFYIMAGRDFPSYKSYGDLCQIENGIGKSADFLYRVRTSIKKLSGNLHLFSHYGQKSLIVSSEYGATILEKAFENITKGVCIHELSKSIAATRILTVYNNFLGGNVKATGLLSGTDIISSLRKTDTSKYNNIFIPDSIFNSDGFTIDNLSRDNIMESCNNIFLVDESGESFIRCITGTAAKKD